MGALKLPADPRAVRLFDETCARYDAFVRSLPEPLGRLALQRRTFLGSPGDEPFAGLGELNPVLAGTPWMFWEQFRDLDDERFVTLAEGGALVVLASILMDHIIDRQVEVPEWAALLHQALLSGGIERLGAALPASSGYWSHFNRLTKDHLAGLAAELDAQRNAARMDEVLFIRMAHGKVSPIVLTLAAMAEACGRPDSLAPLEASLKHIAVASQLLDDIGDWQQDLTVGHVTFFLTRIPGFSADFENQGTPAGWAQQAIDKDWLDVDYLQITLDWLERSADAVRGVECPGWLEYVESYRVLADEHLTVALARHLSRVLRPIVAGADSSTAGQSI